MQLGFGLLAQGANNASKMADYALQRIVEHGERVFDAAWMTEVFDTYWEQDAKYMYAFTNALLEPITPAAAAALAAGAQSPALAGEFFSNFNNPQDYWPWLVDVNEAHKWVAARSRARASTAPRAEA